MKTLDDPGVHAWFHPRTIRIAQNFEFDRGSLWPALDIPRCAAGAHRLSTDKLLNFIWAVNMWIEDSTDRLLWMGNVESSPPSPSDAFLALRAASGDSRPIQATRGHAFRAGDFRTYDQTEIDVESAKEISLLFSSIAFIILNQWDALLFGKTTEDLVEFWEGNVIFYSRSEVAEQRAGKIFSDFGLPQVMR